MQLNWTIKELKHGGKQIMKRNYLQIVIACLIVSVFAGGYSSSSTDTKIVDGTNNRGTITISNSFTNIINNVRLNSKNNDELIDFEVQDKFRLKNATEGVLATIINNSGASSL